MANKKGESQSLLLIRRYRQTPITIQQRNAHTLWCCIHLLAVDGFIRLKLAISLITSNKKQTLQFYVDQVLHMLSLKFVC